MSTPVKTRDDISIRTMLEEHASCLTINGKKYYFLPFYFMDDDSDDFEMLHLDHLPEELKEGIEFFRNEDNQKNILSYPVTKEETSPLSENIGHSTLNNKEA
jgi:hypothetical protein